MGTPSRPPWSAASALTRASTSAASGNTSSTWPTCRPRSIRNPCRSRKPERTHRYSNSHASPDPAVIQLVGAFRAYPQLTSRYDAVSFQKRHHLAHQTFNGPDDLNRAIDEAVIKLNTERNRHPLANQRIAA